MQRLLAGPLFMTWNAMSSDLTIFLLLFFALTLLAATILDSPVQCFRQFTVIFFIATLATTAVIYGSPGTNLNHLLDLQVAAVLLLAWIASQPTPLQQKMGTYALVLALLIPLGISFSRSFLHHRADVVVANRANHLEQVVAMVKLSGEPVLAENPVIPVLADESPYVLDPWMFSLLRKHNSNFEAPLMERLRDRSFGMVVLLEDPETDYGRDWYTHQHFGPGFIPALEQNYRLLSAADSQFIYVPKDLPEGAER